MLRSITRKVLLVGQIYWHLLVQKCWPFCLLKKLNHNTHAHTQKKSNSNGGCFQFLLKKVEIVRGLNPLLYKNRIFDTFFKSIFHFWCNSGLLLWAPWSSRTSGRGTLQILLSLLAELFPLKNRKKAPKSRKRKLTFVLWKILRLWRPCFYRIF